MGNSTYFRHMFRAVAVLAVVANGTTARAETAQGVSQATVVEPLQITNTNDLAFGEITTNGTGVGRVTINARTGARTSNLNVTPLGTTGFGRAIFRVTGKPQTAVNLTTSSVTIILTGPGPQMIVDRIRVNRNNGTQQTLPRSFNIPASGTMQVGFGGRLRVANNQTPGSYSGTFDLTATYQ